MGIKSRAKRGLPPYTPPSEEGPFTADTRLFLQLLQSYAFYRCFTRKDNENTVVTEGTSADFHKPFYRRRGFSLTLKR